MPHLVILRVSAQSGCQHEYSRAFASFSKPGGCRARCRACCSLNLLKLQYVERCLNAAAAVCLRFVCLNLAAARLAAPADHSARVCSVSSVSHRANPELTRCSMHGAGGTRGFGARCQRLGLLQVRQSGAAGLHLGPVPGALLPCIATFLTATLWLPTQARLSMPTLQCKWHCDMTTRGQFCLIIATAGSALHARAAAMNVQLPCLLPGAMPSTKMSSTTCCTRRRACSLPSPRRG